MLSAVPIAHVLVVAPDSDLRRSLAFVFEAEEFAVQTCAFWPPDHAVGQFDILIVDHAGLAKGFHDDGTLTAFRHNLILLGGRADLQTRLPEATIVAKPLLDGVLLNRVCALLDVKAAVSGRNVAPRAR